MPEILLSSGEQKVINSDPKRTYSEVKITKIVEVIGFLTAAIAVLSVISSVIFKYISCGRCLYFDFDLDYYDFSLSNTSKLVFYLSVIAGIISAVVSILIYILWKRITSYIKRKIKHKKLGKAIAWVLICVLFIIVLVILSVSFIPEKNTAILFCTLVLSFTMIIYFLIYSVNPDIEKKRIVLYFSVISISILVIIATCMRTEYDDAKNQKIFSIIAENIDKKLNYYVVISTGEENYSAFLSEIKEEKGVNVLYIITDKHKYFNINGTDATKMKFQEIKRVETVPLTVNEMARKYGQ